MVPLIYHSVRCPHIITRTYVQYCHRMSGFNLDAPSIKRIRGTIPGAPYYTPGPIHLRILSILGYQGRSQGLPTTHLAYARIFESIFGRSTYSYVIMGGLVWQLSPPPIHVQYRVSLLQTWHMLGLAYASRTSWDDPARVKIGTNFSSEAML